MLPPQATRAIPPCSFAATTILGMYYQPELNKTALESLRTLNLGGVGAIQYQSHRHFLNLFVTIIIEVPPPPAYAIEYQ